MQNLGSQLHINGYLQNQNPNNSPYRNPNKYKIKITKILTKLYPNKNRIPDKNKII